jgi:hypothetical protein
MILADVLKSNEALPAASNPYRNDTGINVSKPEI